MRLFNKIVRLFHTVKYLKFKQILGRVIIFLPRFITIHKKHPRIYELNKLTSYINKSKSTSDYKSFLFLSESHNLNIVGWDDQSISKLWRYNLHYFDYLVQEKTTDEDIKLQFDCIENWLNNNKFGKGTGWEPYPTSIRIINWIKWHWKTNGLSDKAKLSLWNQVEWLANRPEYHLLGNHLFINAKALLFACVIFGQDENSNIYRKGLKILIEELREQFLEDGAHFELSPMYHALAMEDLLDLYQLKSSLPSSFPSQEIQEKFLLGMNWLSNMNYGNGELSHFNDCANGIAPRIEELEDLGKKIGLNWSLNSDIKFNYFKESGFVVFKDDNIHLISDVGNIGPDYLPGHAHADSLSFEFAFKGQRVIVNSGTGEYGLSKERLRQRSTSAHSTIELDDKSSSEVWSGFRVARRARVTAVEIIDRDNKLEFAAVHDGYTRIASKPLHKRKWKVNDRCLEIIDEVSGSQNSVQLRYYLHPEIQIEMLDDGIHLFTSKEKLAKFRADQYVQVVDTTYHDRFGISKMNKCLLITGTTPFSCKVSISWNE